MTLSISRRGLVGGVGAALAVVAFDPTTRTWLTTAHAKSDADASASCDDALTIPYLDGELTTDAAAIAEASGDFGNIVSRAPRAVLRPGSERDIERLIHFCFRHRIQVAMRGQGHAAFGEAQAECGVVIDSRTLNSIHSIGPEGAVVDAGVTWRELTSAALEQGLTPLVLADYLDLSVGGVLSVGGIGGNMNQVGSVADNVLELQVVTGRGRHLYASRYQRRRVFESFLGGLGQFGVITQAKIPLGPAPEFVRIYELTYTNLHAYLEDQRTLVSAARFGYHEGQIVPAAGGGWNYKIEVGAYYSQSEPPVDALLLDGLSPDAGVVQTDFPYFAWLDRVSVAEAALRAAGLWQTPNPWSDLFIPDRNVESYLTNDVIPFLTPEQVGAGLVLLYPFRNELNRRPLFTLPRGRVTWAFDILRFPFDPSPEMTNALLEENRRLFDTAVASRGKQYPIGALELSQQDWVTHYGSNYPDVVRRKRRFDPRNIMTPGQGVFPT